MQEIIEAKLQEARVFETRTQWPQAFRLYKEAADQGGDLQQVEGLRGLLRVANRGDFGVESGIRTVAGLIGGAGVLAALIIWMQFGTISIPSQYKPVLNPMGVATGIAALFSGAFWWFVLVKAADLLEAVKLMNWRQQLDRQERVCDLPPSSASLPPASPPPSLPAEEVSSTG